MVEMNMTSIKTSSSGIWQGDNPLNYAFPLLIIQTTIILLITRILTFLMKPLRQPKVIAEIAGGILLGPSALGRYSPYLRRVFPPWSAVVLDSVASIGLIFFLFLVGLELDLASLRRSGRRAFLIAAAGISLPFASGAGISLLLRPDNNTGLPQFVVFMGVAMSITAFPVLARILAELKLLTTRLGETAMAAAAFNDLAAWILLALAVALAGDGDKDNAKKKSPVVAVYVLLSGAGFAAVMMVLVKPAMERVAARRRCTAEPYICATLAGVLVAGLATDIIGIHAIFGAFVFGLTIPKEGEFADRLIERTEDFVSGLLLPLYFASSGLKTDVTTISGARAWGLLVLVITTACAGKILATFAVAMMMKIPARESIALGVIMNTKGLVELIVLNIGKEKKVLNEEIFAIMVLMALFTTFITTPTLMAIYKYGRGNAPTSVHAHRNQGSPNELRILACLHGPDNAPSLITLLESIRSTDKASLVKLFVMHLVELTERSSSIVMVRRFRKNGLPLFNRRGSKGISGAFEAYGRLGHVSIRPSTAVSALSTIHHDVCQAAERKRVALLLLPFHKSYFGAEMVENVGHGWRVVNQRVLKHAPCSVAVLVDRGLGSGVAETLRVCVVFFGGPDDREALELGGRMVEHPTVKVRVVRFVEKEMGISNKEKDLDETTLSEFKSKWENVAEYEEREASSIVEQVLEMGRGGEYELIVVGKGRFAVAELEERQAEHPELGPIGDILTASGSGEGVVSSVLVIQQHDALAHAEELQTDAGNTAATGDLQHHDVV